MSLRRQFIWIVSGRFAAAALQAILMLVLARSVSPAEFGFFAAPYGAITVVQVLFDFGLPTLIITLRSKDRNDRVVPAALAWNDRLAAMMALALLLVTLALGLWLDSRYFELLPLAVWAAAERNADVWLGVTLADGDAFVNTANLVARRFSALLVFFVASVATSFSPLFLFSASVAGTALASSFFAHRYVTPRLPLRASSPLKHLIGRSWPFWTTSVATQARNFDTVLTAAFAGVSEAGFYAAASRLTGPLRLFATSLATVLLPAAARQKASDARQLRKVIFMVTLASAAVYGVLALCSPFAVPIVLGEAYTGATLPIMISLGGLVFASATALLDSVLQGLGRERLAAHASVTMTVVSLLGIAIGASLFGAVGAVCASSLGYLIQAVWLWIELSYSKSR